MAVKSSTEKKMCVKCNKILPLTEFYPNKLWKAQHYHDAWCKDCVANYCQDANTLKEYCHENNRQWKDSFWDSSVKKASYGLSTNPEYIQPHTTKRQRQEMANQAAVRAFLAMMNLRPFYCFSEHFDDEEGYVVDKSREDGRAVEKRSYNQKWGGYFSKEEIQYLEDIYAQYEEDFVLDNVSMRDYARKVAKASLNADIAEDQMRRGQVSASEYKEAQKIFDDLSKSANFAACRRKPGESSGMGSLGEIIMRLEVNGELKENGFTFPEDDIDKIIADFRHTLHSVGVEGRL